jgi:uncharacterized OB-fold protein
MLVIAQCPSCGERSFPPRDRCAQCGSVGQEAVDHDGAGQVVAATFVPSAFGLEGFGSGGYGVAWIDLDDGPRVQALVAAAAPPAAARGGVDIIVLEEVTIPVFEERAS